MLRAHYPDVHDQASYEIAMGTLNAAPNPQQL